MDAQTVSSAYFNAWNEHDGQAIDDTFAPTGVYFDPTVGEISGKKLGAHAQTLWSAFPDLKFALASCAVITQNKCVAEWVMSGTNTGSLHGLPPTGKAVTLKGVDIIEVGEDGIKSVAGYFDSKVVPTQLGLNVVVQPSSLGPFSFGTSVAVQSGNKAKPGAFSITSIWNEEEETAEIQALSRDTMKDMLRMEGFIGATTARLGGRGITVTAWEKPENVAQIMSSPAHAEAMRKFWANLSNAAYTSLWVPHHINPLHIRCRACNKLNSSSERPVNCSCGEKLPEAPAYF
jgi:steroid delta-isomerase-like uncharacterized protein